MRGQGWIVTYRVKSAVSLAASLGPDEVMVVDPGNGNGNGATGVRSEAANSGLACDGFRGDRQHTAGLIRGGQRRDADGRGQAYGP